MLWHETVIYQGEQCLVTSTYSDGSIDLDNGLTVKRSEVEVLKNDI